MTDQPFRIEFSDGRYVVVRKDNGYVCFDAPTHEACYRWIVEDDAGETLSGPPVDMSAAIAREIPSA